MDACLILAETSWIGFFLGVLKVVVALGFVIFVHELGHFAVAKMCGVQCDKFFVGFDIGGYKLSRKWGETEYGIGILPLGGYVRMLGQNDDPSKMAEQLKESQAAASQVDDSKTKEITGPDGQKYRIDRRSYMAKSVPQRMAIISAGVIMNIIFGFIFAVIAFGIGADYVPCVVGSVTPASPAYMAGVEPGDEFLEINGRKDPSFGHLQQYVKLGDEGGSLDCVVRKAATGDEVKLTLTPATLPGGATLIGIANSHTTELLPAEPARAGSPAAAAGLKGGDKIVAVNGQPVESYRDIQIQELAGLGKPLTLTVERAAADGESARPQTQDIEIQPAMLRRLGAVVTMGPVTAVQPGSPADRAGLKAGDLITAINDRPVGAADPGEASWDPSTLPYRLPLESGDLKVTFERDGQAVEATVVRREGRWLEEPTGPGAPFSLTTIGLTYQVSTKVAAVVEGMPASEHLRAGDVIIEARVIPPKDGGGAGKASAVQLGEGLANWPYLFSRLQFAPEGTEVALTVQRQDQQVTFTSPLAAVEGVFLPDPGLNLTSLVLTRPAGSLGEALALAADRVGNDMMMVFSVLRKIGSPQVPLSDVSGPLGILSFAYQSAQAGVSTLLLFLVMLSVNLAVLNFLPIPVLDGGHMVFLAWEGLTGRPANERVVVALHMVGFVMLIGLMVFAFSNDIRNLYFS